MTPNTTELQIEEYNRLSSLLEGIRSFIHKHQNVSYIEFDYYVVHDMILFSIEPDFDFDKLEQAIQQIKKSSSAIKRIFKKPIIFLKDTQDVLPVENARIINQNTLLHLANHTQNISNITEKGIKPRKLLTRIYEDEYGLYENIIFCNYIDDILSLINKNRRILNSIYYASNIMELNLLEKGNHINYFLALGKLHTGYIRDFSHYHSLSKELLAELSSINKTIKSRLYRPIYKKNKKRNKKLRLKKTNIFLKQKDYRMVYRSYKYLLSNQTKVEESNEVVDLDSMKRDYLMYVRILAIFAAGHFNFMADPQVKMDLGSLKIDFTYKDWKLNISNNELEELILEFNKDQPYRILITNTIYEPEDKQKYLQELQLNEIVLVDHFDEELKGEEDLYISVQDIDSFRRIQQILLRGMIYSDIAREVCPFCGGKLKLDKYQGFYQCHDCMIQIKENTCPQTEKHYFYTDNKLPAMHATYNGYVDDEDNWFYRKQVESSMYFRNITKINENREIICPHCNQIH